MRSIINWAKSNITAIILVLCFIPIYIASQLNGKVFDCLGTTSMEYLNSEYYRWLTCIFLHFNFVHIFFNSVALLAVGSLLSPFIGQWKTLLFFLSAGVLAEIACSAIITYSEPVYGGGSSGGIFALIAVFVACYLRYPKDFHLKWYRADVLIVIAYFIFANDNMSSFLTHTFGFVAGIILSFIMISAGFLRGKKQDTSAN